jgi:hypothetical protein
MAGVERDSFADEMLTLRASSLDNLSNTFETTNKIGLSSPVSTMNHDSIRRIDGGSDHLNLDLVGTRLGDVKLLVDRRFLELFDDKSVLLLGLHWMDYIFILG